MSLPASSQDLSGAQCRLLTLLFDRLTPDVSVVPGGAQGESKVSLLLLPLPSLCTRHEHAILMVTRKS